ncbi:hypothetical protein CH63R_13727 [Colletotrichum higginsianum IMI 349063]|uniref:Uncharacterized protein n=1 Tax=Colletotrichum higginsianum (strain IMI 349063) TaxID=759273 RepID=A0A1B7XRW9_COLHI|nr:hypothetical protein CH63R_13727 [Colletotrichum higginsianum IMI 349063]OBR02501.1 hypothetical protein CH63R_13727 [Colletotrichum higginsianum IMI 349063]
MQSAARKWQSDLRHLVLLAPSHDAAHPEQRQSFTAVANPTLATLLPPPTTPHYVSNGTRRSSLETDVGLASGELRSHLSEAVRSRRPYGIMSTVPFLFSTQALCVLVRLKPPITFKRPPAPGMTGAP